ncbi:hypothetical protein scyTo_0020995, partial [Scyliorhinus torazame]|nr:hypothetical protein [Scyliorhinus torazame]
FPDREREMERSTDDTWREIQINALWKMTRSLGSEDGKE